MLPSYKMPMSGAWLVSTPISPSSVLAITISALPAHSSPSGWTSSTLSVMCAPPARRMSFVQLHGGSPGATPSRRTSRALQVLGLLLHVLDPADHVERLLGVAVVVAFGDRLEGGDRLLERHEDSGLAGELLGHEHGVGQEPLDPAGSLHRDPVLFGQLVDTEDGDDVLQLGVALQDPLRLAGDGVVLLADVGRGQDPGCRRQWVHRREDAL